MRALLISRNDVTLARDILQVYYHDAASHDDDGKSHILDCDGCSNDTGRPKETANLKNRRQNQSIQFNSEKLVL